jgi:hypothetical protein
MALTDSGSGRVVEEIGPRFKGTLAGTVKRGDVLAYSSGWVRALATVGTATQGRAVALQDGVSGDVIDIAVAAVISGLSGGTPGGAVYCAEGTDSGEYTETAPSTSGDVNKILGYILAADRIYVNPTMRADSTA